MHAVPGTAGTACIVRLLGPSTRAHVTALRSENLCPGARRRIGSMRGWAARRASIAGMLPNTPEQLLNWLRAPQSLKPGNAMPDLGLSDADARDIAAYLYLIR